MELLLFILLNVFSITTEDKEYTSAELKTNLA